jgi:hypothetical protein
MLYSGAKVFTVEIVKIRSGELVLLPDFFRVEDKAPIFTVRLEFVLDY